MNTFNQKLGQLLHKEALLLEEIQKNEYILSQYHSQVRKCKEEIAQHEKTNHRITLALKSQQALEEYTNTLLLTKIQQLEQTSVRRFNELCRKEDLLSSIKIDPYSFEISLLKHSRPFERRHLSAGENQLLAISLMWALRDVAGIPMPVVIDTPLSSLDNEHRQNMVNHFFPHASHQVILLATDAELTSPLLQDLDSSVSHAYFMEYDERIGKTIVEYRGIWNEKERHEA
jgi:DNA sulfur modification protein DndD